MCLKTQIKNLERLLNYNKIALTTHQACNY